MSFLKTAASEQDSSAIIKATEASLAATLHLDGEPASSPTTPRFAWALIIEAPEGEPAGHAVYYYDYSTWRAEGGIHLEELFVVPQYRRSGYGRMLIEALAAEARRVGCTKLEWICYMDNERALRFYEGISATRMNNWVVLRMLDDDVRRLAGEKASGK